MAVLVGVDGSTPSAAALAWALARVRVTGEPLRLIHVVDDEWGQAGTGVVDEARLTGARLLADAVLTARARGVDATETLLDGSPAWMLGGAAETGDLLVVGTHNTGFLHGRALGSRSIVVASIAPCSVAVIPDSAPSTRHGVVVGVAAGSWQSAVEFGADEAVRSGQELILVHAVASSDDVTEGRALVATAARHALSRPRGDELEVRSRLSRRDTAEALLDAARTATMLVIAPSRQPVDRAGFVGSVTHAVLLNITSPVVVAR